jgi:hypothetical protein
MSKQGIAMRFCLSVTLMLGLAAAFSQLGGCFSASSAGGSPDAAFNFDSSVDLDGFIPDGFNLDAGFPVLSSSVSSEAFGSVAVGSKSASMSVAITNTGTAVAGTLTTSITGTDAAQFAIDTDGCKGMALAAGGTCTISAHFAPTKSGSASAALSVNAMPGTPVNVALTGTGQTAGSLVFSVSTQSFGTIATGATSSAATLTLTNSGATATGNVSVALGGANAAQFALSSDGCSGKPLASAGRCTVDVTFAPTASGAQSAALTATDPAADMAQVALSGTGAAPAAFTVAPATHDFGSLTVGTTSSSQSFMVTNSGGIASGVPSVAIAGSNAADFTVTSSCSAALPPGQTCTFGVTFTPSVAGAEGPATITASAPSTASGSATLRGTGLGAAAISIQASSQTWGAFAWGTTSSDVAFTVTNNGGIPTGALAVALTGTYAGQFVLGAQSNCSGVQLAASGTCTVAAHFAPASPAQGSVQASLTVSGSPGGAVAATLSGDAESSASLAFGQASYPFGPITRGSPSTPLTLTVTNSGGVPSGVPGAPSITGTNAGDFYVVTNNCTAAIGPAASCTMSVVFLPQSAGAESASIALTGTPGGTATAALGGAGLTKPTLAISPNPGNTFPVTTIGHTSAAVTFTVTNSGQTASSALGAPTLAGGNSGDFAILTANDNCIGATLAANGGTCTFQMTFAPSTTSPETTSLTIADSGGDSATDGLSSAGVTTTALGLTPNPGNTFAITAQGQTSPPVTFKLTNGGQTTSAALGAPVFSGGNSAAFAIVAGSDGCTGTTLALNASCTFQVAYTPSTASMQTTTLVVSDAMSNSATDVLTATGVTATALALSPNPGNTFPSTGMGLTSAPTTFTLTNGGQATSGTLGAPTFSGPNGADFAVVGGTDNCTGTTLAQYVTCTFQVVFKPSTATRETATLTVTDARGHTGSDPLTATGVTATSLSLSPNPGNTFPNTQQGQTSLPVTFTLTNSGQTTSATLAAPTFAGGNAADFVPVGGIADTCTGATLAQAASCTFQVVFVPSTATTETTTLSVADGRGAIATDPLSATGVFGVVFSFSPSSGSFLPCYRAQFTLTNTGQAASGTLSLSFSSTDFYNNNTFGPDTCTGNTLAPAGGSCSFWVYFDGSQDAGAESATVTVTDSNGNSAVLPLTGVAGSCG